MNFSLVASNSSHFLNACPSSFSSSWITNGLKVFPLSTIMIVHLSVITTHFYSTLLVAGLSDHTLQKVFERLDKKFSYQQELKAFLVVTAVTICNIAMHAFFLSAVGLSMTTVPPLLAAPVFLDACLGCFLGSAAFFMNKRRQQLTIN